MQGLVVFLAPVPAWVAAGSSARVRFPNDTLYATGHDLPSTYAVPARPAGNLPDLSNSQDAGERPSGGVSTDDCAEEDERGYGQRAQELVV